MELPGLPANLFQERAGILAVASEVNRLGLIWRETSMVDVGIDGHIEFVNEAGRPTGQLIAVQVKCGPSYFHDHGGEWWYYPEEKHRSYWERFPLPVIVMLHSPDEGTTYWVDARFSMRSPLTGSLKHIAIPKLKRLQTATRQQLFSSVGASGTQVYSIPLVLAHMVRGGSGDARLPITYFDLFVHGLVNIGRSLYYGMALVTDVAEIKLSLAHSGFGLAMGWEEHEFLWTYVCFLVEQHLADVNMSDALIDWVDRELHPQFIAPLTSRGRELVALIQNLQNRYESAGEMKAPEFIRVAQEGLLNLLFCDSHCMRFPVIERFQEIVKKKTALQTDFSPANSDTKAGEPEPSPTDTKPDIEPEQGN